MPTTFPANVPLALPRYSRNGDLRRASRCIARAFECFHRGELTEAKRAIIDAHEAVGRVIAKELEERRNEEWDGE